MTEHATATPSPPPKNRAALTRFAWLSIATALFTIGLKSWAYLLTGSVGLFSDAVESLVNLAGALMALAMLSIAARPADREHPHGHSKAEYFSSGVEGSLIVVAAILIIIAAIHRLITPQPIEQVGIGLLVSSGASVLNLVAGMILLQAGKNYHSITLVANAKHLMTDVWTSVGVILGVGAVAITGWLPLDPIIAILVAINILWSGGKIVAESVTGLMDAALPEEELATIREVLQSFRSEEVHFHALLTRKSGAFRFVSFHVLVPGQWSVQQGHQKLDDIEAALCEALPHTHVITHLEPLEDPASWDDVAFSAKIDEPKSDEVYCELKLGIQ